MRLPILIPAAGASSRMRGEDKLLEEVAGQPCLRVMAARASGAGQPVFVTLPHLDHPRAACLQGLACTQIAIEDAHLGMSRSLVRGVAALPADSAGVMILPADMPGIEADDINAMLAAFETEPCDILQASTADGAAGHPVIFHASLFARFQELTGDQGAKSIVQSTPDKRLFPLPGSRALRDLDTPEDWAAWRAEQA